MKSNKYSEFYKKIKMEISSTSSGYIALPISLFCSHKYVKVVTPPGGKPYLACYDCNKMIEEYEIKNS